MTTNPPSFIFDSLIASLRSKAGGPHIHEVKREGDSLTFQVGVSVDSLVGVRIVDAERPLFQVSYTKIVVKRDKTRRLQEAISDGVGLGGISWIVDQIAEHGAVYPEFVD